MADTTAYEITSERAAVAALREHAEAMVSSLPWTWHWGDGVGACVFREITDVFAEHGYHAPDAHLSPARPRNLRVLDRDGWECRYCGVALGWGHASVVRPEVDHVVPRCDGGGDEMDNLAACCGRCNNAKGRKSLAEFLATR